MVPFWLVVVAAVQARPFLWRVRLSPLVELSHLHRPQNQVVEPLPSGPSVVAAWLLLCRVVAVVDFLVLLPNLEVVWPWVEVMWHPHAQQEEASLVESSLGDADLPLVSVAPLLSAEVPEKLPEALCLLGMPFQEAHLVAETLLRVLRLAVASLAEALLRPLVLQPWLRLEASLAEEQPPPSLRPEEP